MARILIFFFVFATSSLHATKDIKRTIVTLYDKDLYEDIWFTRIHQYAEMPLNHYGMVLEYYDINEGLPDIRDRDDVRGVLSWFPKYTVLKNPQEYLQWGKDVILSGKKFVLMGTPGFLDDTSRLSLSEINDFLNLLGLKSTGGWIDQNVKLDWVVKDPRYVDFERDYIDLSPFVPVFKLNNQDSRGLTPHLVGRAYGDKSSDTVLVATGPNGGIAYEGYESIEIVNNNELFRKWYLNPFEYFRSAFDLYGLPNPDTTTLAGRRIYYSHIDGDGWNSVTEVEKYRRKKTISAEVILHEIVKNYPEWPVTVAPVAADIDPTWVGVKDSDVVTEDIMKESNVEAGTHTYSHPFKWSFFEDYSPIDEEPYLERYVKGSWKTKSFWTKLLNLISKEDSVSGKDTALVLGEENGVHRKARKKTKTVGKYDIPRAYAQHPFNLEHEIQGSIAEIEKIGHKKVELLQWSGDCMPFPQALAELDKNNIPNLNGGDTRFDRTYDSYSWVRPVGKQVNQYRQVYASMSNENTYTNLWQGPFYGFRFLPETLKNTESPIRLKPANLYYHMYSGSKLPALEALIQNMEFLKTQQLIPIFASAFAGIANGFYDVRIEPVAQNRWKIKNRRSLQTIRFDEGVLNSVDFDTSTGVIGQQHFQGSLYIALDPVIEEPVIALKKIDKLSIKVDADVPYLIQSQWQLRQVDRVSAGEWSFIANGFGPGNMTWYVPNNGRYSVLWEDQRRLLEVVDNHIEISLPVKENRPIKIRVVKVNDV